LQNAWQFHNHAVSLHHQTNKKQFTTMTTETIITAIGDVYTVYTETINGYTAKTSKAAGLKYTTMVFDLNDRQIAYKQFARKTDALNWGERTIEDAILTTKK
jgi:hypothetical protein